MSTELELWRAHEGLALAAAHRRDRYVGSYAHLIECVELRGKLPGLDDPTPVPPGLQYDLQQIAERRSYPVRYVSKRRLAEIGGRDGGVGLTSHPDSALPDWLLTEKRRLGVTTCPPGMYLATDVQSSAALARTTCHELAHVFSQNSVPEELEETVAESTAGIVTGLLRITNGVFSVAYLSQHDDHDIALARQYAVPFAGIILSELEAA